jgi:AcrR family transcriptional regulator
MNGKDTMPARSGEARSGGATRTRILAAAISRFASQPYEATGLRDIAADAGVDVAYVHRSFGSKEGLFAACLEATRPTPGDFGKDAEVVAGGLVDMLFQQRQEQEAMGLEIVIRSISSRQALRVLRDNMPPYLEFLANDFGAQRAALAMSFLFGFTILREVIKVPQLNEGGEAGLKELVRSSVESLLRGDLHMLS